MKNNSEMALIRNNYELIRWIWWLYLVHGAVILEVVVNVRVFVIADHRCTDCIKAEL